MSTFDQASLVMIPSGYKTSKIYSVKPTDGSGDLVVSRSNDTATRVGPNGLIEKVRTNLYPRGSALLATGWDTQDATLTAGQTDPNGGTGALRVQLAGGAGTDFIAQVFSGSNIPYTRSVYIKAASAQTIRIVEPTSGANKIVSLTTSYQRFDLTSAVSGGFFGIRFDNEHDSAAKDFTISLLQIETGDIATDYIATTSAAVSVGPVANVPRLDYLNSSCPRLLLEPQRVNLVNYSEQMTLWANGTSSVTANATTSPDGYQNADRINNTADVSTFVSASNGVYTFSLFVKQGTSASASIDMSDGATGDVLTTFTFATKTFSGTSAGGSWASPSTAYQDYGNGWYRISLTATKGAGSTIGHKIIASGTGTTFVWGAQLEAGAYATSYIPTLGAAVTRGADACSKTGISSLIGQTEGVVFFDFTVDTVSGQTNDPVLWYMKDGGTGERYVELYSNGNLIYLEFNGVTIATITKTGLTVGRHKCAVAYANNDMTFYVDGVQIGTDTSGTPSGFSTFALQYHNTIYNGQQKVNQILLFKTRLTNAQLAELTTL